MSEKLEGLERLQQHLGQALTALDNAYFQAGAVEEKDLQRQVDLRYIAVDKLRDRVLELLHKEGWTGQPQINIKLER